jgi:hypothetical protein
MLTVFYGNQVYGEYPHWHALYEDIKVTMDVYQSGYVYNPTPNNWQVHWSRCDGTPVMIDYVPAICKAWILIL